jgi:anti-sigma factor RsiW
MDSRTPIWHLGDEAVYDYVDRALSSAAMTEAERHVLTCPECARRVRQVELLFARLETLDSPRLDRDLAPGVVVGLQAARKRSVRWHWVLAAQASTAIVALAALGFNLDRWVNALLNDPAYLALRQSGLRLVAEASAWLTPFLAIIPSLPTRLAAIRISLPHLEGPVQGWAGLAVVALLLGLVGNAVLLRLADGVVSHAEEGGNGRLKRLGPMGNVSRGGRP